MALLRRLSSSLSDAMALDEDGTAASSASEGASAGMEGIRPPQTPTSADDNLSGLGRSTESLLRAMRLDVVLLGSREEEMLAALAKLERQWQLLERLLEQQEMAEGKNEEEPKNNGDKEDGKTHPVASSIDWDGDGAGAADGENQAKDSGTVSEEKPLKRVASQSAIIRTTEPEKVSSQLARSNFDWPLDGDVHEEARRASLLGSTGESFRRIISGGQNVVDDEEGKQTTEEDVPILSRIFQRRSSERTGDEDHSVAASVNKQRNNPDGRWNLFGSDRSGNRKGEGPIVATNDERSVSTAPPRSGKNNTKAESPFRRLFRNKELDASSNTGETVETQPPSNSDASLTNKGSGSPNPVEEPLDAAAISSLMVKLRGCDLATSSLQQLLTYQTRNLLDLRHKRNALRSSSQFNAEASERELQKLRDQLANAKVERRRKARLLEDALRRKKTNQYQEERLKGELESIRLELFTLRMQMSQAERDEANGVDVEQRNHEKVVIVGGSQEDEAEAEATEWRTPAGEYQRQATAGTPDSTFPSSNRKQYRQQQTW